MAEPKDIFLRLEMRLNAMEMQRICVDTPQHAEHRLILDAHAEIERLRKQRDALLAACKDAFLVVTYYGGAASTSKLLHAAIALAESPVQGHK